MKNVKRCIIATNTFPIAGKLNQILSLHDPWELR
ncbi:hypothetical protein AN619_03750 [Thermotalea metallivorans]|uniref:Uncharacterized protein n=1 Tax=Thermotalea metallivorans TaxID=520762 RepID=A0A140LB48_9FIRM|nr:hypothetical protein AN619_03750 [Thermotalea metallivorans]